MGYITYISVPATYVNAYTLGIGRANPDLRTNSDRSSDDRETCCSTPRAGFSSARHFSFLPYGALTVEPQFDPDSPVFQLHAGGKLTVTSKVPLVDRQSLSLAYTPGVAEVCEAIAD